MVGSVEQPLQGGLDLLHQPLERRVQVADRGPGQGGQHAGADIGGARPHQHPAGRFEALAGVFRDPDLDALLLDATVIRAHPCAAGGGITRTVRVTD